MDFLKVSEGKIKKGTGKSWDYWANVLDKFDVKKNGHTATARYLREREGLSDWWAQFVTIRYEKQHGIWKRSGT